MKRTFHSQKLLLDLFNLPTTKTLEDFINHVNHHRQESEKLTREQNEKVKVFRVATHISELHEALAQTKAEKRTAVIISSLESKMQFEHLLNGLGGQSTEVIYIRDYEQAYKNPQNRA
jgi:phosphomevalonate kinase